MSLQSVLLACNRNPQAASILKNSENSLVVFGGNRFVCVYDPEKCGIQQTLAGHRDLVICTSWIQSSSFDAGRSSQSFVSGGADHSARLWTRDSSTGKFKTCCELTGHTGAVQTLCSLENASNSGKDLIITGSADATCRVWLRDGAHVECVQTIEFFQKYPLAMAVSKLPGGSGDIVLAVGGTDLKIHIYVASSTDMQFVHKMALSGHTDWIRSLDFAFYTASLNNEYHLHSDVKDGDLLLVSSSQDRYIRLWRLSCGSGQENKSENSIFDSIPEHLLSSLQESSSIKLSTKAHVFNTDGIVGAQPGSYAVFLDAVLMGHDDWVYSVQWHPTQIQKHLDCNGNESLQIHQPMKILSASSDKTVIVWSPDKDTGIWTSNLQVGDFSGHTFGVYGALWNVDGSSIICFDYHGSFQIWKETINDENQRIQWKSRLGITGHSSAVHNVSWDPTYNFLLSCSHDQTTRVFAPWSGHGNTWHECARPQVHGYDLRCITFTGPFKYASGSDGEKVIRMFDASQTFVHSVAKITGQEVLQFAEENALQKLPVGAAVPALGLSNKATDNRDLENEQALRPEDLGEKLYDSGALAALETFERNHHAAVSKILDQPPTEDHLQQYTLWPETEKLYGHGNEIFSIASSHDFRVLASASACRAGGQIEDAAIRIWDLTGKPIRESQTPLLGHQLTVTAMQFSWNDDWLISVGRDRSWCAYRRNDEGYVNSCSGVKAHARIIWDLSFSFDDKFFVTGSRDKLIKMWGLSTSGDEWTKDIGAQLHSQAFHCGVTSTAFAPIPFISENEQIYLLAVGLESGEIILKKCSVANPTEWKTYCELDPESFHVASVTKMAWRVILGDDQGLPADQSKFEDIQNRFSNRICVKNAGLSTVRLQLATCSEDTSIRIFDIPCDI